VSRGSMRTESLGAAAALAVGLILAACGGGATSTPAQTTAATGPINIWYSNNAEEITWGEATVSAWNKAHPDQLVTANQIPAGKSSEEVISAAITAGTTPCLIFNTSPAAVPQFRGRRTGAHRHRYQPVLCIPASFWLATMTKSRR
jgi:multiple sugar transport system substrate-binding protein